MRDLWKILDQLEKRGIDFNIQVLNFPAGSKYNLRVNNVHGKAEYLHAFSVNEIEQKLKLVHPKINEELNPKPSMPMPAP